jgi:glucose-1-phosphate thymidylyltransferase
MQAVILAAGRGTRLQPLTATRTKAMAPVAGRPLVDLVLDTLVPNGVSEVILVVSPDDEEIREYFADRASPALQWVAQHERLGMAKALALASPYVRGTFLVSACDTLTSAGHVAALVEEHRQRRASATLSLLEVARSEVSKTGIVVWDAPYVRRIVEKPRVEDAPSTISSLPLYVFEPDLLDLLPRVQSSPRGEYELQDAIQMMIEETGRVVGVFAPGRRQVTNMQDLLALNVAALDETPDSVVCAPDVATGAGVRWVAPVRVDRGTVIEAGATIGPRVYLERNSRIGAGAVVQDTLVLRDSVVPADAQVRGQVWW